MHKNAFHFFIIILMGKMGKITYLKEMLISEKEFSKAIKNSKNQYYVNNPSNISGKKHIVFLAYSKHKSESYYFLSTTTKGKEELIKSGKQILITKNHNNKNIYLNVNDIYESNFNNNKSIKFKNNNNDIYYKNRKLILEKLSNKKIKFLKDNTTMFIYETEYQKRREKKTQK